MPDFEKIRQSLKAIVAEHGGKIEINEWNASDGETMKAILTFKSTPLVLNASYGSSATNRSELV